MSGKNEQIQCVVTGKMGKKLPCIPYAGELGKKIYAQVSRQGWDLWLKQLTMLINDYGLRTCDESAKVLIEEKMNEFFFSDKSLQEKTFKPEDKQ